jgi:ABC-2 type transport system ATP-binding protein
MKAIDFLDLFASFYNGISDKKFRDQLIERLDLNPYRQMKHYSRGNKQKIGIIAAFMNKPGLLILDEPTASLDPLMQQTILELVQETKKEGRTVFFSSHNLTEVQAVCDRVGIIREGALIKTERVETLTRQRFIRLKLTLRDNPPLDAFQNMDGVIEVARDGHDMVFEVQQNLEILMAKTAPFGITDIETLPVTLEEIFLAFYGRNGANHV